MYSSQNGRGVGRERQRQMRLRWRFPVAGLPLVNSVLRFARQCVDLSHAQKKNREGTCLIKCPSTRILIVLKIENFFSSVWGIPAPKMQVFEKTVHRVEFFLANAGLLETLVSLRNRTAGRRGCKMLVCDKRGRVITYVFCRQLAIYVFGSFTKRSV